jgi:hypothetical protein
MTKPHFILPKTKYCIVVWFRDGKKNETLLETPKSNNDLRNTMLMTHKVGFGELRAVKDVDGQDIIGHIRMAGLVN